MHPIRIAAQLHPQQGAWRDLRAAALRAEELGFSRTMVRTLSSTDAARALGATATRAATSRTASRGRRGITVWALLL